MERQNEIIQDMQKQILKIQKENKELKHQININTKNTNNYCNNTQIINNIQLVAFGKENLLEISDNICKTILNKGFMSVQKLIEHIHFNKNNPKET